MTFAGLVTQLVDLVRLVVAVLITMGLLIFFWGIVRFIFNASSSKASTQGRSMLVWGLITMFVMFSIWGILGLAQTAFFP